MKELRLLIVEDNERDLRTFRNSVNRYKREKGRDINLVECQTFDEALKRLDNSFDGAVIDIKLTPQGTEGNQVVEKIIESFFRIPIAIFTGNQGSWDDNLSKQILLVGIFRKGANVHFGILDQFWDIYTTGLTRIMGGRGKIEENLSKVFLENLLPQLETWVSYGKKYFEDDPERTEKALLRYTLNHLFQLLEADDENCFPEEVYLYPPLLDTIITGSIVQEKASNQRFVILTPACDLVIRNSGDFKADRILLAEIEVQDDIVHDALADISRKRSKKNKLEAILNNNYQDYYHWLPETDFFNGGFLNFRKLKMLEKDDFEDQFEEPSIQISPFFMKDIVARFSTYYARQGQPDIDSKDFVDHYTQQQS